MTKRIPRRDIEALSAYLDGQLSDKQRSSLESKIHESAEYRDALNGLRKTRAVIRSQPPIKAPKNFTLSPEMVGLKARTRRRTRLYPLFGFASAVASLLFVLVVVGDFVLGIPQTVTPQMMKAPVSETMVMEAPAAPVEAQDRSLQVQEEAEAEVVEPEEVVTVPEVESEDVLTEKAITEEGVKTLPGTTMEEVPGTPAENLSIGTTPEMKMGEPTETFSSTQKPTIEVEEKGLLSEDQLQEDQRQFSNLISNTLVWRVIEGLLAMLAMGSGIIALVFRRREGL